MQWHKIVVGIYISKTKWFKLTFSKPSLLQIKSFSYQTISIKYVNPYCNQWNVAITKIICLNSTCNLRRAYFAIKQINSISIVQKTIAKYHGNFAIKIQGPAKFTSNIQVNVSHRYIKWIILLWLLNKMKNINEWNWKDWFTPPILF